MRLSWTSTTAGTSNVSTVTRAFFTSVARPLGGSQSIAGIGPVTASATLRVCPSLATPGRVATMATEKKTKGVKAEFVREHPELKPSEIAEKAKAEGVDISAHYVSNVRASDKATVAKKRKAASPKKKAAVKKAPSKKKGSSNSKATGVSKTSFIRENSDLSAADLVAAGTAKGITLSNDLVYKVRSKSKAAVSKTKGALKARLPSKTPAVSGAVPERRGDRVKTILHLALANGVADAVRLIDEVKRRLDLIA
jgi:hypothetical protein